jgi:hypothetical protein
MTNQIQNNTSIMWTPLKTCVKFDNCQDCQAAEGLEDVCYWCNSIQKCTSGLDRNRPKADKVKCVISMEPCQQFEDSKIIINPDKIANYHQINEELHKFIATNLIRDDLQLYDSQLVQNNYHEHWDIMVGPGVQTLNQHLSTGRSVVLHLPFDFPLFGEVFNEVIIGKEGIISLLNRLQHEIEDQFQFMDTVRLFKYIAPLRADFQLLDTYGSKVIIKLF